MLRAGAGEIDRGGTRLAIDRDGDADLRPIVHRISETAVLQPIEQAFDRRLGIGLDVPHIGRDHISPILGRDALQLGSAARAGGDLRLEIGDVAIGIAGGPVAARQHGADIGLQEPAAGHHRHAIDQHAFLAHVAAARRHRPRADPADIGMVAARSDIISRHRIRRIEKDRHHHRHVGQVGAAIIGRVEREGVARTHRRSVALDHRADTVAH